MVDLSSSSLGKNERERSLSSSFDAVNAPQIFKEEKDIPKGTEVVDAVASMRKELFSVRNPGIKKGTSEFEVARTAFVAQENTASVFIYYPWLKKAVRTLPEAEYFELRTARNKHLITTDVQEKFRAGTVAVAGLSVGSAILNALVQSGGPKVLKIADMDVVEATNLNRLRAGLPDILRPKTETAAHAVWDLDPYAEVELFENGVTSENIEAFMCSPKLDLLIDEVESIEFKIRMRQIAKRERIPVIMATDNGNGIILDIERFDLEPERSLFHNLPGTDVDPDTLKNLSYEEWLKLANAIVGIDELEESMRFSIGELGKSIPSIPQLGASAAFAGAAVAYAARQILSGQTVPSGRYSYTLESLVKNPKHS